MNNDTTLPRSDEATQAAASDDAPTIRLGDQRLQGVVFVAAPSPEPRAYRVHETKRTDIVHVSTDDVTRTPHIRGALLQQIVDAKQKVLFCSFLFADEEIVRALCEAAERLHGGVYVLTALGKHLRAEVLEPDADIDANTLKLQERAARHEDHLQRLARAGVWLRSAEDCHAKFCVVDDGSAVVTSANATQEAYESNPEDGLVLRDAHVARELGRLFAHVWRYLATLESTPGQRLDVHSLASNSAPRWRGLRGAGQIRAVTTLRRDEGSLLDAAIDVIDRAKERLVIATYSFMGMENHPVGAALARALGRNVRIDLLVQPRNHIEAQRRSLAWLCGLAPDRVRLHGHRRTHTKSIVSDGQTVLLWTGNLESRHGWDNGIEVGVVVDDHGVASAVEGWTTDVMGRRTHLALNSPSARELVDAGQPSALRGEWSLHLPGAAMTAVVTQALTRSPVELLDVQGRVALRCGDELVLEDVRVDAETRRIDISRTRRVEGLVGARGTGWLSDTVLRVVAAAEQPAKAVAQPRSQQPQRGNRGARR